MRVIADFVPRACQKCAPKSFSADGGNDRSQVFWQRKCGENVLKNIANPFEIRPKMIQKRVRRHLRAPKSPDKAAGPHFYQSFGAPGPYHHYDFDHFGLQKHVFLRTQKRLKHVPRQNHIFSWLFAISTASGARFSLTLGRKSDPRRSLFKRFSGDRFYTGFFVYFW